MSDELKILLCYKEHKKVVVVSKTNPLAQIYDAAKQFHSDPLVLQYYDVDFDEWIDVTDDHIPVNKERFKILELETSLDQLSASPQVVESHGIETDDSLDLTSDNESLLMTSTPDVPPKSPKQLNLCGSNVEKTKSQMSLNISTPSSSYSPDVGNSSGNQPVIVIGGTEDKEIPYPFPFPPHFPPDIEMGLQLKQLHPKQLGKVYTRVANTMFLYKRYPTKKDYESVADQLLEKYPFLKSPLEADSTGHIVKSLQDRYRELRRKPDLSSSPGVKVEFAFKPKRGRRKLTTSTDPKAKRSLVIPSGEDNVSFKRHNSLLVKEHAKVNPNKAVVAEGMRLSYEMRRNDIVSNMKPVRQILAEYPFLGDKDQVYDSAAQQLEIVQNPASFADLGTAWREKWAPKLLKLCTTNLSGEAQDKALILLESAGTDSVKNTVVLMELLPLLVPDHKVKPVPEKVILLIPESLIVSIAADNLEYNTPILIVKQKGWETFLVVEKQVLCKIPGELSPLYLLSAYYVFDIVYPKGLSSMFMLLEKILLGRNHTKTPQIVSRIFGSLGRLTD